MTAEDAWQIYSDLKEQGITIWLDGGWGVDALLGKQTRPHKDLDIVIQQMDIPKFQEYVKARNYKEIKLEEARPHNFVVADDKGHEIDVHVIVLDEKGNGIYGPVENGVMYPANSLAGVGNVGGHTVQCLTAEYQVESHSGYELKEKDYQDVKALCEKFNIPLPKEYEKFRTNEDKSKLAVSTYEKIADIYTKQYFNDLTDASYIDKFLEKLPPKAKILDVGSGPGQFTKYIMDKGYDVIGIDFSKEMVSTAKKMVPNGDFHFMDMRKLEFEDNTFDGLLVAYSLIHIPSEDIPQTLKGFHRVLKPQGYLEIIAQKGEADKVIDEPFMPSEKMFFNFFTKERLKKFLQDADFEIDYQFEADSQDPDSVSDKVIYTIAKKSG